MSELSAIEAKNVSFFYDGDDGKKQALCGIDLSIPQGDFVAVLGENGCGKSTLARLFNALLPLREGELRILGRDVRDKTSRRAIRKSCAMVFQNPDNQFVSSIVREDVAFGLENYGTPREEIPRRVSQALHRVALDGFEDRAISTLSGGQKQRLAIAGVLALEPQILIFDEATAMLDPMCRREVLSMIRKCNEERHTIVMITHDVEEAVQAKHVLLMHGGRILAFGDSRRILSDTALLARAGIEPPAAVRFCEDLKSCGIALSRCPLTARELSEELCRLKQNS